MPTTTTSAPRKLVPDEPQPAEPVQHESIKDTIESIVIALILAFVFRAFVVEAFVIPTGSMAPTLYGAHATILCEDCGTEFAYGLRDPAERRRTHLVGANSRAVCPNCNHPNTNLKINDTRRNPETGDRILVLKWPFDIGGDLFKPARWDVVVFKDPADGKTNFIKRQVGLPNEVLSIIDGDVYTVPLAKLSSEAVEELDRLRHQKYQLRTRAKRGRINPLSKNLRAELDGKLRIARKTPETQRSLWTQVYNHDYPPRAADMHQPRWEPIHMAKSGWDATGRRLRFKDRGTERDCIDLRGKPIRADCSYNIRRRTAPPVSDQRVRFVLTPETNDGAVFIKLVKLPRAFWAAVHMNGLVTITESGDIPSDSARPMLAKQLAPFAVGRSVEISFENVDYRLALHVGGKEVLATSSDRGDEAYYGPDIAALRKVHRTKAPLPPRICGRGGESELTHLVVDRDTYYYHAPGGSALTQPWGPKEGWASPDSPILLREGEFFMLGDNTSASKDSRLWDTWGPHMVERGEAFQLGTVPRDQLIGKAFFVYWPSPHRLAWLPFLKWGLIPDVGRMRWIR